MVGTGLERCADLAHLPLEQLRAYRGELATEEDRVSYWRRLIQARLDVVRGDARSRRAPSPPDPQRLREALSTGAAASRRTALVRVRQDGEAPPLPDLAVLWASLPGEDPAERAALVARLERAEQDLSAYRTTLHRWIDEATTELIARYREDPSSCLAALPLQGPFARR
ncbi:hypothetical protein [Vallicoccus soli]|uniref:RsiG-like domain-containing protein n=1 Tax=Vallicoccus soli TaxID=2339232 RepID=A0A3A3ZM85_9ACTN|nr:hypothetical protein [Vallicoccus soli]RJK97671.1 hypothetical protein D5H78_01240 [Vallicoccus soli]